MEPWIVPIVVTRLIVVSDALSMSSPATMAPASTLIGNVTNGRIATMEVTSETVITSIPQQSVARSMSVLMAPVLNIPSAVMVAETAGMVRMNTIVHVGRTSSRVTMASAYQNIWSVTGNQTVGISLTSETVPAQGRNSGVTPVSAFRTPGGVTFGSIAATVPTNTVANHNVEIMSLPAAMAVALTTDKSAIDGTIVPIAAMS